jgi:hypothetical protein
LERRPKEIAGAALNRIKALRDLIASNDVRDAPRVRHAHTSSLLFCLPARATRAKLT